MSGLTNGDVRRGGRFTSESLSHSSQSVVFFWSPPPTQPLVGLLLLLWLLWISFIICWKPQRFTNCRRRKQVELPHQQGWTGTKKRPLVFWTRPQRLIAPLWVGLCCHIHNVMQWANGNQWEWPYQIFTKGVIYDSNESESGIHSIGCLIFSAFCCGWCSKTLCSIDDSGRAESVVSSSPLLSSLSQTLSFAGDASST